MRKPKKRNLENSKNYSRNKSFKPLMGVQMALAHQIKTKTKTSTKTKTPLKTVKNKKNLPVSPSPYSAMESVSLSGPTFGSLLIEALPCDLLSKLLQTNESKKLLITKHTLTVGNIHGSLLHLDNRVVRSLVLVRVQRTFLLDFVSKYIP